LTSESQQGNTAAFGFTKIENSASTNILPTSSTEATSTMATGGTDPTVPDASGHESIVLHPTDGAPILRPTSAVSEGATDRPQAFSSLSGTHRPLSFSTEPHGIGAADDTSPLNKDPTVPSSINNGSSSGKADATDDNGRQNIHLSLDQFRIMVGLPNALSSQAPKLIFHTWLPSFISKRLYPYDPEQPTSMYFAIRDQEQFATRQYKAYDLLIYTCLFVQLVLSAVLVILAALPAQHHITLAILGGVNGVITGILSLVKGQGMPMRLIKFADSMRKVRQDIEEKDRELRTGCVVVTLADFDKLKKQYDAARNDEIQNMPDIWNVSVPAPNGTGPGNPKAPTQPHGTNKKGLKMG
jgi:SMODS and SLOG-associating 2TM effector domain